MIKSLLAAIFSSVSLFAVPLTFQQDDVKETIEVALPGNPTHLVNDDFDYYVAKDKEGASYRVTLVQEDPSTDDVKGNHFTYRLETNTTDETKKADFLKSFKLVN